MAAEAQALNPSTVSKDVQRYLRIQNKHFKGVNLLEELNFSCFYHFTTWNQLLHFASVPIILFGIISLLNLVPLPAVLTKLSLLGWVIVLPYTAFFMYLDPAPGLAWGVEFGGLLAAASCFRTSPLGVACDNGSCGAYVGICVACIATLILQGVGHVVFERRLPAFRGFEATVITPFFLMLNMLFWCGFKPELRDAIYNMAPKWRGTERRTF